MSPNEVKIEDLIAKAEYKQHPFGKCWQPFDPATFNELAGNVDRRGLDIDITLYQGKVLDGWHRYLACLAAQVTTRFKEFNGTDLEAAELVHASGIRRLLNADQRYMAFTMLCNACQQFKDKFEALSAKGKQQQKEGKPLGTGGQRVDVLAEKAKAANVSKSTAKKNEKVIKENPAAIPKIMEGNTSANKELAKLKQRGEKKGKAENGQRTNGGAATKEAPVKGERPKIEELIQILYRGLSKADEVQNLAPKAKAIEFKVKGYRVKVTCKIMNK